ncbi:metallophosphoesterase [Hymenobacter weizhouensis]|uniref:metallophosphoesterase n=1 Tax=Hymenobacter sp. YIM 151500-1 TaxID=2987689 RepID=UPI002227492A|nr:metallophosphoesterase [Hymenobacter sp. YIM 151500-1]UYZ63986.1 metallophosphoesterase [Hymenobacter sp. YIM 151500-1]
MKKIVIALLVLYALYFAAGVAAIQFGAIERFYFFPYFAIKYKQDRSGYSADGPVLLLRQGYGISKQIIPSKTGYRSVTDTLPPNQPALLTCYPTDSSFFHVSVRASPPTTEPDHYPAPEKMLVVSDIEGNFAGFRLLLTSAGVMDQQYAWRFGRGHLVLVGDFFDRGLNVTECLWLIYKLEQEAEQAGGKVHFILGNHEIMNLMGKLKYVRRKYLVNADSLGLPYESWYAADTELGRWLRTKNVVEKIGSTLFLHGGLSPEVAAHRLSLTAINTLARRGLDRAPGSTPAKGSAEEAITSSQASPDWYRGLVQQTASDDDVGRILQQYQATRMVVGHTPVDKITPLYGNRVVAIDLPHQQNTAQGYMQAVWIEGEAFYTLDNRGNRSPLF